MSQPTDPTQLRDRLAALREQIESCLDASLSNYLRNPDLRDKVVASQVRSLRIILDGLADLADLMTMRELLADAANLASITHQYGSQGGHDQIGADYSCAGCQLAEKIKLFLEGTPAERDQLTAERDRAMARTPLVCADDRHQAKVRGLEAEVERLNTELAGWQLHYDPPPRAVTVLPDISGHQDTPVTDLDFDGCGCGCKPGNTPWPHTMVWGQCSHAVKRYGGPAVVVEEYGHLMSGGGVNVWPLDPEVLDVYPLAKRIEHTQRHGTVLRRRVVVLDPWEEL